MATYEGVLESCKMSITIGEVGLEYSEKRGYRIADLDQYYTGKISFEEGRFMMSVLYLLEAFIKEELYEEFTREHIKKACQWTKKELRRENKVRRKAGFAGNTWNTWRLLSFPEQEKIIISHVFSRMKGLRPIVTKNCERWVS